MDGNSFDRWTRTRAVATNRRSLLGLSMTAGVATVLSRVLPASAQFGGGGDGSCTYDVTLTSSVTAGATVTGELVIEVGQDGAIDAGILTLDGQPGAAVVGQATGLAIDLQVALPDGTKLALSGVASGDISSCSADVHGLLANADNGQLGTWSAQPTGSTQPPTPTPASAAVSGGGQSSGSSGGSGGSSGGNGGGSTDTCPAGQFACGPNCCPSGSSCLDNAQGICGCPGGTLQCGSSCVPECSGDEFLNLDTCQCEVEQAPVCVPDNGSCSIHAQCCSGYCGGGTCFFCGGKVCGDYGCIDPSRDNDNCGNCNNSCIAPLTCQNGVCQ